MCDTVGVTELKTFLAQCTVANTVYTRQEVSHMYDPCIPLLSAAPLFLHENTWTW
jgi:hypothetical protein